LIPLIDNEPDFMARFHASAIPARRHAACAPPAPLAPRASAL
jgi:hypothetical protein